MEFSVIIPTYNRSASLRACLKALTQLIFPANQFEIIVVDDGSESSPAAVVNEFREKINLKLFTLLHGGPAKARNYGASKAQGKYLAFTDDDCEPDPRWLEELEKNLRLSDSFALSGRTENALFNNLLSSTTDLLYDYFSLHYATQSTLLLSNNMALCAYRFHDLGGFEERFSAPSGEDREFSYRWLNAGLHIRRATNAVVRHAHPLSVLNFCRLHFRHGESSRFLKQLGSKPPETRSWLRFQTNLIREPFHREPPWRAVKSAALLTLTQALSIAGYFTKIAWGKASASGP